MAHDLELKALLWREKNTLAAASENSLKQEAQPENGSPSVAGSLNSRVRRVMSGGFLKCRKCEGCPELEVDVSRNLEIGLFAWAAAPGFSR